MNIRIERSKKTKDGIFGFLLCGDLVEATVENLEHAIRPGTYSVVIDRSPRLKIETPHIRVPDRDTAVAGGDSGIRIHPANYPDQLLGCIAVGEDFGSDEVENSRKAFDRLMVALSSATNAITLEVVESYL